MRKSAGILLYRTIKDDIEVLLVHPGGPLFDDKNDDVWSIPKGEFTDEEPFEAAKREFEEELGRPLDTKSFIELSPITHKSGKVVFAWATEGQFDTSIPINSNTCEIEYPKGSKQIIEIPEVDKAQWFSPQVAKQRIVQAQFSLVEELLDILSK